MIAKISAGFKTTFFRSQFRHKVLYLKIIFRPPIYFAPFLLYIEIRGMPISYCTEFTVIGIYYNQKYKKVSQN